jgi:hypothetical protein
VALLLPLLLLLLPGSWDKVQRAGQHKGAHSGRQLLPLRRRLPLLA